MSYWVIWPIVTVQILGFALMFVRRTARLLNVPIRIWIIVLFMLANIAIGVSLYHDVSPLYDLYF